LLQTLKLPGRLDDLDQFVEAVAVAPCELDEVSRSVDDGTLFGCADYGAAAAAAELEQALVAEGAEGAKHGVGVHAEHRGQVSGGWEPFAGLGLAVCDRATDLSSGDVRGRLFTSVVAPEDSVRARELFTSKVLGTVPATETTGTLLSTTGARVAVEISSAPLMNGERVVGVFGLFEGRPDARPPAPPAHLTPVRQRCFAFSSGVAPRSRSPTNST
jgi:hypothetical protein